MYYGIQKQEIGFGNVSLFSNILLSRLLHLRSKQYPGKTDT